MLKMKPRPLSKELKQAIENYVKERYYLILKDLTNAQESNRWLEDKLQEKETEINTLREAIQSKGLINKISAQLKRSLKALEGSKKDETV
jgi:ketol-acid reductoisomerase